ncbi:MAG: hypothetical protein UR31_C0017G0019 [Parcubacteria group bacterium GW2011_GWA2_33_14]|nr:MAG: hypothetical protein UR31_C0017G0019 [Parcubacteria group bacterium GW2011_GWA2_33_14]
MKKATNGFNQLNNFVKNKINAKRYSTGFTIIELIITIAILSFGILGAYSAFAPFFTLTYNVSYRLTAVYLAQEGLEIVRNLRDNNFINSNNWSDGLLECDLGCQLDYKTGTSVESFENQLKLYDPGEFLKINSDNFYSYDLGDTTKFQRKITINQESGTDVLKVSVIVTWDYNGKPFSFESEGYLYNWY